jgi:hypothetical protein
MADSGKVVRLFNDVKRQTGRGGGPPPGGPGDGDLAQRISRIEQALEKFGEDLKEMRGDLRTIRDGVAKLNERVAGIEGRLTGIEGRFSAMPTALQLLGFAVAVIVASGLFRMFDRPAPVPTVIQQPATPR